MEKEDYHWVILALGILLLVGLFIKPALTHEAPNFQLPQLPALPSLHLPTPYPTMTAKPVTMVPTQPVTTIPTTVPGTPAIPATTTEPAPQTVTVRNGSKQTVEFVDPGTYNVSLTSFVPRNLSQTQSPYRTTDYTSLLTSPISGQYSGTTQVVDIPFPYWELWYTVETTASDLRGQGEPLSSYSTVMPSFSIDVVDTDNPSSIVRTIIPLGSLDPSLWQTNDPRPWKEKFLEGNKRYYFIIKANMLSSYSIDIKVPTSYLKKI